MTRMQTIEQITAKLATLDDERLQAVAEMIDGLDDGLEESVLPRELTARELELIEQSKEDFRQGRTLSLEEAIEEIDGRLEKLGVPRSST